MYDDDDHSLHSRKRKQDGNDWKNLLLFSTFVSVQGRHWCFSPFLSVFFFLSFHHCVLTAFLFFMVVCPFVCLASASCRRWEGSAFSVKNFSIKRTTSFWRQLRVNLVLKVSVMSDPRPGLGFCVVVKVSYILTTCPYFDNLYIGSN